MPHVALVTFAGFRIREEELRALGMELPGLAPRGAAIADLPALGLLTLAGMLPEEWTCRYHAVEQFDTQLCDNISVSKPDLVAISALTASALEAYDFADWLRQQGIPSVMGGLHATACPDEVQGRVDVVVVGDGESCWPQLLRDFERGDLRSRYQADGSFNLADAPLPAFELLTGAQRQRYTLQTQRGCPLACEFCAASRLLGGFREKPLANLQTELDSLLRTTGTGFVELADDNTFINTRRIDELAELFSGSGVRYFSECDWRIGERPDFLKRLAASGLVQVLLGIESLAFRYPGMGAKQAELARMMDAVAAIQDHGIVVNGCFIVGADGETNASLDRLTDFVLNSSLGDAQITIQTPFPGTALRDRLRRQGRLLKDCDWSHHTLFDVTYQPDRLSAAELASGFRRVVADVFAKEPAAARQATRRRIWRRNPSLGKTQHPEPN